ncbi:MAG TPA: hypothetical protein VF646_14860 [Cytophagales bacterium]|jgi:hypothetical protein
MTYRSPTYALLLLLVLLPACREAGCKDPDAANYQAGADVHDGFCVYRYLLRVTLREADLQRSESPSWDAPNALPLRFPAEQYPDLRFDLRRRAEGPWTFQTPTEFDCTSLPVAWEMYGNRSEFLRLHEEYQYRLVDEDERGLQVMHEGTFVPAQVLQDNQITLRSADGRTLIELDFIVR